MVSRYRAATPPPPRQEKCKVKIVKVKAKNNQKEINNLKQRIKCLQEENAMLAQMILKQQEEAERKAKIDSKRNFDSILDEIAFVLEIK